MSTLRVALADDSSFIRRAVARLLDGEPDMLLVGSAAAGEELLAHLDAWNPDAIVLDLSMPGMNGLEVLDRIMRQRPTPVIILSTHSRRGAPLTLEALHRGAMDFIDKQEHSLVDFERLREALLSKIRGVCGQAMPVAAAPVPPVQALAAPLLPALRTAGPRAIVLGASTGGPPAIELTLRELGRIEIPVLVAQHMPAGFTRVFAERLNGTLPQEIREAEDRMPLEAGTVLLAPGGWHLRIHRDHRDEGLRASLSREPRAAAFQPSIDVLFHSASEHLGADCIAVLLTGMGSDGAGGMLQLAQQGAHTIAQDETTSLIFGMPRAAIAVGAAREVLPLPLIGRRLRELAGAGRAAGIPTSS